MILRALALPALLALSACTGAMMANIMPGEVVEVNGNTFTVNRTARGITIQNFETGRTPPSQLIANAALAAERVTGCTVETITKEATVNTYFASVTCPA